jgi:NhaA family Na+:H+ antiporter
MSTGKPPLSHSWIASDRSVARYICPTGARVPGYRGGWRNRAPHGHLATIIWANSPVEGSYEQLWTTEFSLRVGHFGFTEDLRHVVDDGFMTVFFFGLAWRSNGNSLRVS